MKKNIIYLLYLIISVMIFTGCGSYLDSDGSYLMTSSDSDFASDSYPNDAGTSGTEASDSGADITTQKLIFVQVSGAVENPGVYTLVDGSRVFEVIEKAGGLTIDADDLDINQAALLMDGQRIHVFREGEREAYTLSDFPVSTGGQDTSGLININTADNDTLCTLPGIGSTRAAAIISFRSQNGSFKRIEDIMLVPGIKDSVFSQIKQLIKV